MELELGLEKVVVNSLRLLGFMSFDFPKDMRIVLDEEVFKK